MKNSNIFSRSTIVLYLFFNVCGVSNLYCQATIESNLPTGGAYLGWSGAQNLELRTNNLTHLQIMETGNTTINGFNITRSGFVGLSQNPAFFTTGPQSPFSLLHLNGDNNGSSAQEIGYRSWMRHGITLTHNQDLMYVGQRRLTNDVTDAVIAWADNEQFPGPDNLCFVFTKSDGSGTIPTEPDTDFGREIARMTAVGHTGIGIQWSNTFQPKRTLDVVRHENIPQFRITRLRSTSTTGGIYTDFETSEAGNLHIYPRNGMTKNVGIGFLSGTSVPTERLDVYDGTARLRLVPSNEPHVLITGRMQDTDPTTGDYVLNHLAFNGSQTSFLAGDGTWQNGTNVCDWNISGQNLTMGYTGACHTGNVGIGESTPPVKLTVLQENNGSFSGLGGPFFPEAPAAMVRTLASNANNTGVLGIAAQSTATEGVINNVGGHFLGVNSFENNYGISARANSDFEWVRGINSYGVHSKASLAERSFGVHSSALEGDITNYGVYGQASQPHSSNTFNAGVFGAGFGDAVSQYSFGVVGYAAGATSRNASIYGYITPGSTNSYAGYFAGPMISGTPFHPSDEMLKQNVAELEGGLSIINQLYPKTYNYQTDNFIQLGLPEGIQHGFLAQDIAQILPELTNEVLSPPLIDTLGNELAPSVEFLAVNYTGLIPILVSAVKEQQTIIESQNEVLAQMMEQLASMQQQINQCCNANDGTKSMPGGIFQPQDLNNEKSIEGGNELYQNIPNPFRESTTISYQLETGGRVQLSIYDGNGKVVTTLVEANQPNGRHSAIWNANGMPAGVYHYTLYVDGELLVKRAIKLQE